MASKKSLQKAAQAWCSKDTEHVVMNVPLCKEFAGILDSEKNNYQNAIGVVIRNLKTAKGLWISFQSNIAMAFYDEILNHYREKCKISHSNLHKAVNDAATHFLNMLCE